MDLLKAFDTINHKILINKLDCNGFRGIVLDWLNSYLTHVLLLPTRGTHYELRARRHNFTPPVRSSTLTYCNFINRMLFKDLNYSFYSQL